MQLLDELTGFLDTAFAAAVRGFADVQSLVGYTTHTSRYRRRRRCCCWTS